MISSPCKSCSMKNQPKDECLIDCKKIEEIQEIFISIENSIEKYCASPAIDCAEAGRFVVSSELNHENSDY